MCSCKLLSISHPSFQPSHCRTGNHNFILPFLRSLTFYPPHVHEITCICLSMFGLLHVMQWILVPSICCTWLNCALFKHEYFTECMHRFSLSVPWWMDTRGPSYCEWLFSRWDHGSCDSSIFSFLRNLPTVSYHDWINLPSHQQYAKIFSSSHPC